jgi:hypothetical protein
MLPSAMKIMHAMCAAREVEQVPRAAQTVSMIFVGP